MHGDSVKSSSISTSSRRSVRIKECKQSSSIGTTESEISLRLNMDIRTVKKYIALDADMLPKDSWQKGYIESVGKKGKNTNIVRNLKEEGYGIRQIARLTGFSRETVRKYLNPNVSAVHGSYGVSRGCPLAPFHSMIDRLIIDKQTFKNIEEHLRHQGYTGSSSAIRMYTTRKRRLVQESLKSEINNYELIDRKHLVKLLYKPIEKVTEISKGLLERILSEYRVLSYIYRTITTFKEVLFCRKPERLDAWINSTKLLNITEINSFIKGIEKDIESVKNSIIYEYSNGLAEGNVNKIKVVKRIMYGRCKFETLRRKVLSLEQFRKIN